MTLRFIISICVIETCGNTRLSQAMNMLKYQYDNDFIENTKKCVFSYQAIILYRLGKFSTRTILTKICLCIEICRRCCCCLISTKCMYSKCCYYINMFEVDYKTDVTTQDK